MIELPPRQPNGSQPSADSDFVIGEPTTSATPQKRNYSLAEIPLQAAISAPSDVVDIAKSTYNAFKPSNISSTLGGLGDVLAGGTVNAERLRKLCQEKRTMVIADEMHHLGLGYNWGDAYELAFGQHSIVRLMTSGTPFRSDQKQLPWVRYRDRMIDLSPPHAYSYGYGLSKWNDRYSALSDRVVRDVVFHPWDGQVDFTIRRHESGEVVDERSFSHRMTDNIDELYPDVLDPDTSAKLIDNKALRAQIKSRRREACIECGTDKHPYGTNYVRDQLVAANEKLTDCRRAHPWAGGLIVCNSIKHADAVASALKHWTGEESIVVHDESGNDARAIREFRENRTAARFKWIISVAKISEGVDIKHLRVCVYLTRIQAPLRWIQIIGRILRTEPDLEWDLQTAHHFQYEDGIENVESDDGGVTAESANIKLLAETLLDEKWATLEARPDNGKQSPDPPREPPDGDFTYYTVETLQATGFNTQQIYDGIRHDNQSLEPLKILAARLQMPAVKIAALIEKGGEDEWRRALETEA
jgi:superfamily II DNA or RNA helicase